MKKKQNDKFEILSVRGHIHVDGDVYVSNGKGHMYRIGKLCDLEDEHFIGGIPNRAYLRAKKWVKLGKKLAQRSK